MIRINLLPSELRGRKGRAKEAARGVRSPALGNLLVVVWLVAVVALIGFLAHGKMVSYGDASRKKADAEKRFKDKQQQVSDQKAKSEELLRLWDRLQTQQEILNSLMPENRLLWSEKLNMLAKLVPEGVFVTRLEVTEKTDMIETERSRRSRENWRKEKESVEKAAKADKEAPKPKIPGEPEVIQKPLITQILKIKGAAVGSDHPERYNRMLQFEKALRTYEQKNRRGEPRRFMDGFADLEYIDVDKDGFVLEDTVLDGVQVWAFDMQLRTKIKAPGE